MVFVSIDRYPSTLLKDGNLFFHMFGYSMHQFYRILNANFTLIEPVVKNLKISPKILLLELLFHFRYYMPDRFESWLFNINRSTLALYRDTIIFSLYKKYSDKFDLPNLKNRKKNQVICLNQHITVIVDGTEQPMVISSDRGVRNMTRSKKKEKHSNRI